MPTNFAFLDDGGFLLADGYGAFYIHRYDKDGKWLSCFGGPGEGEGKFNTPHGVWVDRRAGREPSIVVCDRANNTLQYFTMDGKYLETLKGYGLPANAETWKNLLVIPELHARITLLNEKNEVVARLGDDVARITGEGGMKIRGDRADGRPANSSIPTTPASARRQYLRRRMGGDRADLAAQALGIAAAGCLSHRSPPSEHARPSGGLSLRMRIAGTG